MFVHEKVKPEHAKQLLEHFGEQKLTRVSNILREYASKWELEVVELIPYFSVNVLFRVKSKQHGAAVLKIHTEVDHYTFREIAMLSSNIPLYCSCYLYHEKDGVILLKEVEQAASLHQIKSLDKRLDAFIEVYNTIHIRHIHEANYPSYGNLLENIREWAIKHKAGQLMTYIDEAFLFYDQLKEVYKDTYILHGDLHHDNILLNKDGDYIVIDPKGVIDIKVLDIPRFILNELEEKVIQTDESKIINTINYLSHKLNINKHHLAMTFAIESILSITWTLQDESTKQRLDDIIELYIADHIYCRGFVEKVYF